MSRNLINYERRKGTRVLHLKGNYVDEYIVIDKIERFAILRIENSLNYTVDLFVNGRPVPLATKTDKPHEMVKDLLKSINTIDNEIVEYTVKGESDDN